jgi:hypothetical protein
MSSPIAGFASATPLDEPIYWWLEIGGGTEQSPALATACGEAMKNGLITSGMPEPQFNSDSGEVFLRMKITIPNVGDRFALPGDFVVIGTNDAGELLSIELCKGPDSTNTENRLFADHFAAGDGS